MVKTTLRVGLARRGRGEEAFHIFQIDDCAAEILREMAKITFREVERAIDVFTRPRKSVGAGGHRR